MSRLFFPSPMSQTFILQDRFAEGNRMPTVDPQQDWELLSGIETDSYTILKFRRELVACDTRDRTIRVGVYGVYTWHIPFPY